MLRIGEVFLFLLLLTAAETVWAADPDFGRFLFDRTGFFLGALAISPWALGSADGPDRLGEERPGSPAGLSEGVILGRNYRFDPLVLGLAMDLASPGASADGGMKSRRFSGFDGQGAAHAGARIGLDLSATRFSVQGGLALADLSADSRDASRLNDGSSRWGWTAGVGLEQIMSPRLKLRLEYLCEDFGKKSYATPGISPSRTNVDTLNQIFYLGLKYTF